MESKFIISVIVPVYNGEKFIRRSIDSVLCQMDGRIELILVDDGSTDSSGAICDEYAADNSFIQAIHKPNGGPSSARNAGIANASGQYIVFLDADDSLDSDTFNHLCRIALEHQPDIIDYGWKYISRSGETIRNLHKLPKDTILDKRVIAETILPPLLNLQKDADNFIFDFACTKAFRRDILCLHNIRFDETRRIWEDRSFTVTFLYYCNTFYASSGCFYNYVDTPASLSRRFTLDFFDITLRNFQLYKTLFGTSYDFDTPYVSECWANTVEKLIFRSLKQTDNRDAIIETIIDTLRNQQVIHWLTSRNQDSKQKKAISRCLNAEDYSGALEIYKKQARKNAQVQKRTALVLRTKALIHKIVRR